MDTSVSRIPVCPIHCHSECHNSKIFSGWPKKKIEIYFFKVIVRTKNKVVVGMLEFSGNAIAILRPGHQAGRDHY